MPVIANLETPAENVKKTACDAPAGAIFCFAKNDRTLNKTLFPSLHCMVISDETRIFHKF